MSKYSSKINRNSGVQSRGICIWCGNSCKSGCQNACSINCGRGCADGYKGSVAAVSTSK